MIPRPDFPASGFQLHIHEGETTKPSSLMDYSRRKILISSYDAAMADGGKSAYDAMDLLETARKRMLNNILNHKSDEEENGN